MKPSAIQRLWTDPTLLMSPDFFSMSYILFQTDGDPGRVVAARVPDVHRIRAGDNLIDRLELSEEALIYMAEKREAARPLLVLSELGLGILWNRYTLSAGLGLYLHIHANPTSAARLINSMGSPAGMLISKRVRGMGSAVTAKDERSYRPLMEACEAIQNTPPSLFPVDDRRRVSLADLRETVRRMAAFVGCDLSFTLRRKHPDDPIALHTRVGCYRPLLLEAVLLCLLTEIRDRSATRGGVCCLELPDETSHEGLVFTLRYPVLPSVEPQNQPLHTQLVSAAALAGLDLYDFPDLIQPRGEGDLPLQSILLDWLYDPTLLPTADLKARLDLLHTEAPRPAYDGEEIPLP